MNYRFILTTLCIVCISFADILASAPEFHNVKATAGDGVYSLLRRYGLEENRCNLTKFYELNSLEQNAFLHRDKKYVVPIYIYEYNGKSIRSTIGIGDWDKAVRIKEYNEKLYTDGLRKTHYTVSKLLWVPFHEVDCQEVSESGKFTAQETEEIVSAAKRTEDKVVKKANKEVAGKFIDEPLFGKDSKFEIKDRSLANKVFYLISGHGGPDPGARCLSCPNTLCEDEYAYDVVLRVSRELMSRGAIVHTIIQDPNDGIRSEPYLKCDKDEICLNAGKIPLDQKARLHQRVETINNLFYKYKKRGLTEQVALVIHVDSRNKDKQQDVFFYHYEHSKTSKKIAKEIQTTFKNKYEQHQKGRGYSGYVSCRNLYMVRNTLPPAIFVELANIRNPKDQQRLLKHENREALAQWLCEGMINGLQ